MAQTKISRGDATRGELKRAARRLFAERGIAAVGMREIVEAAGQRNAAAVHYYFGSKDELLRELVVDGARLIDDVRQAMLDAQEADGEVTLRGVVGAMVLASIDIGGETGERDTYIRFIGALQGERRQLFADAVRGRDSEGYARCMAHVHRLLPELPGAIVNQRLLFAGLSLQTIMAAREAALDASDTGAHPFWSTPSALDGIIDAIEAILRGVR